METIKEIIKIISGVIDIIGIVLLYLWVYFLFGNTEDGLKSLVNIGEGEDW